jgi:hypothetical protein
VTLTCQATSEGGTAEASVTLKRDATAPTLAIVVPALYDVQPVGTALDFGAVDTVSGLAGPAMATLTRDTETLEMASGGQPGVGVYGTVVVEATDQAGNTATSEPRLLVIYDPEGGFVTGGGNIKVHKQWALICTNRTGGLSEDRPSFAFPPISKTDSSERLDLGAKGDRGIGIPLPRQQTTTLMLS